MAGGLTAFGVLGVDAVGAGGGTARVAGLASIERPRRLVVPCALPASRFRGARLEKDDPSLLNTDDS